MTGEDVVEVRISKKDGSGWCLSSNQREDRHYSSDGPGKFVREASEEVKREAQDVRDRVKKAGLLP